MIQPALRVTKAAVTITPIIFQSGSEPGWAASATPQLAGSANSHVPIGLSNLINLRYAFVAIVKERLALLLLATYLGKLLCMRCNLECAGVRRAGYLALQARIPGDAGVTASSKTSFKQLKENKSYLHK